jgi:hypothetical protein
MQTQIKKGNANQPAISTSLPMEILKSIALNAMKVVTAVLIKVKLMILSIA